MKPGYRVKAYKHPKLKWVVRGKERGKWVRKYFETKAEAEGFAQVKNIELNNHGIEGAAFPLALRALALESDSRLAPFGKTLRDAVDFYLPHLERESKGRIVRDVAAEILAEKQAEVKAATLKPYRTRVNAFVARFGERNLVTIAADEIKAWLDSTFADAVTRGNTRRVIVNFLNLAKSKKYIAENPLAVMKLKKEAAREIRILSPQQVAALLDNSTPEVLPYFAIAAFAGIRPEELLRLGWSDVKWKQGVIRVRAEASKVGMARNVPIEENLQAWLEPYRFAKGRVCPAGWRDLFRATRAKAGVTHWPHDCLRHSYATYWLEKHKDAPALALRMGNSVSVILQHYSKVLDEPSDAAHYWQLSPSVCAGEKVVAMTC
jgi:site-specific recombinase XerD